MKFGNRHGSQLAAWWNIVICGLLVVFGIYFAITQSPFGFFLALIGAAMEVNFVRILLTIRREQAEVKAGTFQSPESLDK